jgi:hypothetical protein
MDSPSKKRVREEETEAPQVTEAPRVAAQDVRSVTIMVRKDAGYPILKTTAVFNVVLPVAGDLDPLANMLVEDVAIRAKLGVLSGPGAFAAEPITDEDVLQIVKFILRAAQLAAQFPLGSFNVRVPAFGTEHPMEVHSFCQYLLKEPDMSVRAIERRLLKQTMFDATQKLRMEMALFKCRYMREVVRAFKGMVGGWLGTIEDLKTLGVSAAPPHLLLVEIR